MALIGVLWLIALIGALALAILAIAKIDYFIAHAAADELAAEGRADAGIFVAIHVIGDSAGSSHMFSHPRADAIGHSRLPRRREAYRHFEGRGHFGKVVITHG